MKIIDRIRLLLNLPQRVELVKISRQAREITLGAYRKIHYLDVAGIKKWDGYEEAIDTMRDDGFNEDGMVIYP